MVLLARRENVDVSDADMAMGRKLQPAAGTVVGERERESWHGVAKREIEPGDHWNQPNKFMSDILRDPQCKSMMIRLAYSHDLHKIRYVTKKKWTN
jgi:hypothetical protein